VPRPRIIEIIVALSNLPGKILPIICNDEKLLILVVKLPARSQLEKHLTMAAAST
jgi:hypothetical protein